jgi:hypothetical protein
LVFSKKVVFMQRKWYLALFGMVLLGTLTLLSTGLTLAASTNITKRATSSHSRIHHDNIQDFRQGRINGYNDCQNQLPHAQLSWQSQSYARGYDQGFTTCENQEMAGGAQGNAEGYNDGYQACQAQHQQDYGKNHYGIAQAPVDTGYQNAYGPAWNQGYAACQAHYA